MQVIWTESAKLALKEIYNYYKRKASVKVAQKIRLNIFSSTKHLDKQPKMGHVEELLEDKEFEYRYLVEGNYKIIYFIKNKSVFIATVFDTRQSPEKLKKKI
ncbi:MAG: hypothetical protein A3K10_05165 [Bacteroidetes bacterium RIFCSPLOWO2_12_FULL_31_6]|nr:MAG: hypothetical protein A3K10_05165 [Bacteroidetes bacterium RIFCSPLOWO2_12_FULL_31_6]